MTSQTQAQAQTQPQAQPQPPRFAREMAEKYRGGAIVEFIIYGNVSDLQSMRPAPGMSKEQAAPKFVSLRDYLAQDLLAGRDMIVFYDESAGISFATPEMGMTFLKSQQAAALVGGWKAEGRLPREPLAALDAIGNYIRLVTFGEKRHRVAVVIDYAQTVVPAGEMGQLGREEQACLVTLLKWANDPAFVRGDVTVILVAESLADVSRMVVRCPHVAAVEIPLPDEAERREFIDAHLAGTADAPVAPTLATLTAGLSRVNVLHLIREAQKNGRPLTSDYVNAAKKALIEKECYGLLEFVAPTRTLDDVAGHDAARQWLEGDAALIRAGRIDALPMGYLFCGPVGTGKTYLAMCFAGSIGVPCVTLKNFRSQWQGVTEGNWEKILAVLRATGPVGVIIDEADAAVGDRDAAGDSGTSSRVFSMLAAQMGDTRYRGRIIWFLLTCRPDLLPVDLKRQGRAEVHIPLFPPHDEAERRGLYEAMAKKMKLDKEVVSGTMPLDRHLTGAEVEAILVRARRRAFLRGAARVEGEDVQSEAGAFLPPQHGEEIELQTLAAVIECSDQRFLPERYKSADRAAMARRTTDIRARLGR